MKGRKSSDERFAQLLVQRGAYCRRYVEITRLLLYTQEQGTCARLANTPAAGELLIDLQFASVLPHIVQGYDMWMLYQFHNHYLSFDPKRNPPPSSLVN